MTPTLSISIMHCNDVAARRVHVARMLGQLLDSEAVFVEVVKDVAREGLWPTARRAWRRAGARGATHHLVLQDDVTLCRDFVPGVLDALAVKPDVPVSPYCPRKVVLEARAAGSSWAWAPDGVWGQALVMPLALLDDFWAWDAKNVKPEAPTDDGRFTCWARTTGIGAYIMVPSLLEHELPHASTIGIALADRRAAWFLGENVSARGVDWTAGAASPVKGTANRSVADWAAWRWRVGQ